MECKSKAFQRQQSPAHRKRLFSGEKGFSLVELMIAVAIIGLLALAVYPSIINSLETRSLENEARVIMTTLQRAKFEAVKTRLNHRVRFATESGKWVYVIEREQSPGDWTVIPGFLKRTIPSNLNVSVSLADQQVQFLPLGIISNFSSSQNTIIVKSSRLEKYDKPSLRTISIFSGGSIQYTKSQSE